MRPWLLTVASFALLASACSGAIVAAPVDDAELVNGQNVYARNCASCHGSDGGGGRGWKLNEGAVVASFPNVQDQADVIANGRRTMPAFGGRLTDQDLADVVRYTREIIDPHVPG